MKKKPLFGMITDLHIHDLNIDRVSDAFYNVVDECTNNKIDILFILGDIFDNRKNISFHVLQGFIKLIDRATSRGIKLHIISGNHDKISYHSKDSFLDVYAYFPNVTVYRDITYINVYEIKVWLLPFFDEKTELLSRLEMIKSLRPQDRKSVLLTHIAIDGVKNNDGSVVDGVVNRKTFSLFEKVFVGHYHDKQQIDNILYIGSLIQHDYSENELKGLTILYDDLTIDQVPVHENIFLTVEVDLSKYTKKEIESTLIPIYKNPKDRVRFKFIGTQDQIKKIDKTVFTSIGIDVAIKNVIDDTIQESEVIEFSGFNKSKIIKEWGSYCDEDSERLEFKEEGKKILEKI